MNTSELKQTLVARACSYELAQAIADEIDRLRAENARQRAWIDGVMAQEPLADCTVDPYRNAARLCTVTSGMVRLITRPAQFEDK